MTAPPVDRMDWAIAAALAALTFGLFLYIGLGWALPRDDAIYLYGGLRMLEGDLPYQAIFDHKGPGAQALAGIGASLGRAAGLPDWLGARGFFALLAALTPAVLYAAMRGAGQGRAAALAAAVMLPAVAQFDLAAVTGPRPKIAFVLFEALAIWATVRHRWALAGISCALATLVWQPGILLAAAILYAAPRGGRWRALLRAGGAGLVVALAVIAVYAARGALPLLFDGMVVFNLRDLARPEEIGLASGLARLGQTAWSGIGPVVALLGLGLAAAIGRAGRPAALPRIAGGIGALFLAFSVLDLQGPTDLLPLLPPAAIGVGIATGRLVAGARPRLALAAPLVLALAGWSNAAETPVWRAGPIGDQVRRAETLAGLCAEEGCIYFLGDTPGLALSGRTNPSPYGFILSGMGNRIARTEPGGLSGWLSRIDAPYISIGPNRGPGAAVIGDWLERNYTPAPDIAPRLWRRTAPGRN